MWMRERCVGEKRGNVLKGQIADHGMLGFGTGLAFRVGRSQIV
jgi:hypothetical protein